MRNFVRFVTLLFTFAIPAFAQQGIPVTNGNLLIDMIGVNQGVFRSYMNMKADGFQFSVTGGNDLITYPNVGTIHRAGDVIAQNRTFPKRCADRARLTTRLTKLFFSTANDIFVYGNFSGVSSGSTVILSAGTITTTGNVAAAPPANGSFTTFLTSDTGVRCSNNGVLLAPSAASVSVSGRVLTSNRSGVANASVYLTDQNGELQVSRTNPFGYYHFEDVRAGQTVILTVVSKRFQFAQQVLNLSEEVTELNFVAEN